MNKTVYICLGKCGAKISEEQYKKGLRQCGDKTCNRYKLPFQKMYECSICKALFEPSENHKH